jgi:hypothetical protein
MSFIIQDGTGSGQVAKVNGSNRLYVDAVQKSEQAEANIQGDAYNINTGQITLTSASESAILYIKNTDSTKRLFVSSIAIGLGPSTGGVATEIPAITVLRNPTTGTIIESTPTDVDINSNRNFSSSNSLTIDAYKGGEAETFTDGTEHIIFYASDNSRLFADIEEVLENGASLGIKIDPQGSNTNMTCYAAVVCHVEDM